MFIHTDDLFHFYKYLLDVLRTGNSGIIDPFVEYQNAKVKEQECHEDYLGDEFTDDINSSTEELVIP